jgi:hypothetical protein
MPVTTAPMIGMKAPKNTSTASGRASGTPRTASPTPMNTASTRPTAACALTKPDRVTQERCDTAETCGAARGPTRPLSHGRNFGRP